MKGRPPKPDLDRFIEKIIKTESCWLWEGRISNNGYGQFRPYHSINRGAHQVAYELFKGKIPTGLCVCHTCDIKTCVNPDHLFLGTHKDNMTDMVLKQRSSRLQGEDIKNSKLKIKDVRQIRFLLARSNMTQGAIATLFDVSRENISRIKRNLIWRHL